MIEYNKEENRYTENEGAKISSHEVLIRLRTLEMLQEQIRQGQLLPIHLVSDSSTIKAKVVNIETNIGDIHL